MPVSVCNVACCSHSKRILVDATQQSAPDIMLWPLPADSRLALVCREPDAPHQLHFDMDEAQLRKGPQHYQLMHPVRPAVISQLPSMSWTSHMKLTHAVLIV